MFWRAVRRVLLVDVGFGLLFLLMVVVNARDWMGSSL